MDRFFKAIEKFNSKLEEKLENLMDGADNFGENLERLAYGETRTGRRPTASSRRRPTPPPPPPPMPQPVYAAPAEEEKPEERVPVKATDYLSPRLQSLIEAIVTDGVVTEEELKILVAKGEEENIAADELLLVVNARLFEVQQEHKNTARTHHSTQLQDPNRPGKCPSCGAINPSGLRVCAECGRSLPQPTVGVSRRSGPPPLPQSARTSGRTRNTPIYPASVRHVMAPIPDFVMPDWMAMSPDDSVEKLEEVLDDIKEKFRDGEITQSDCRRIHREILSKFPMPDDEEALEIFIFMAESALRSSGEFNVHLWRTRMEEAERMYDKYRDDSDD